MGRRFGAMKQSFGIGKGIVRKIQAFSLSLCLVAGLTPVAYADQIETPVQQNQIVGGTAAIIFEQSFKLGKLASDVLERSVVFGLCKASDVAQNECVSELFAFTKRMIAGPLGGQVSEIQAACSRIEAEITQLQDCLNDSTGVINASISALSGQLSSMEYDDYHNQLAAFFVTYEGLYNDFVAWSHAVSAYADNPTSANLAAVQTAYDKIEAYYLANTSSTEKAFNFDRDLQDFLMLISPYSSGAAVNYDLMPADQSGWGSNLQTKTYFDALYDDLSYHHPFEHDMYVYMTAGMNEAANAACMYLSAYRMYVEFGAQMIDANPSISEAEKTRQVQNLWAGYQEHAYKTYRGLEQAVAEYGMDITGYMRSYDVDMTVDMIYHDSYSEYVGYGSHEKYDTSARKTSATMEVYQVKPVGDTLSYVIRKGSNSKIVCGDLTEHAFTTVIPANKAYGPTADFMNLSYVSYPHGYSCINSPNFLQDILSVPAYIQSGSHLTSFLKSQGLTDLPNIMETGTSSSTLDEGQFLLTTATEWDPDEKDICDVTFLHWINISQPLYASSAANNTVRVDGDEGVHSDAVKNDEFMMIHYGNPVVDISTSVVDGEGSSVSMYEVQGHKQSYFANYQADPNKNLWGATTTMACGGVIEVHVKPAPGKTIKSVSLKNKDGQVLDDLIGNSEFSSEVGDAITAQEVLEALSTDEDGCYVFRVGIPYQTGQICVEFTDEDPALTNNEVMLETSDKGDLQFASRTGVPMREFTQGSTVNLSVRPFQGYLPDGVKLYKNYGTDIQEDVTSSLSLVNTTSEDIPSTPNAQTYSFVMPAYDVTAVALYQDAPTVIPTVINKNGGTLKFTGVECQDQDWLAYPVSFEPGSTVQMTVNEAAGFECSELVAYKDRDSSVVVELTAAEDGVSFVMPDYDVIVRAVFGLADVGEESVPDDGEDGSDDLNPPGNQGAEPNQNPSAAPDNSLQQSETDDEARADGSSAAYAKTADASGLMFQMALAVACVALVVLAGAARVRREKE